MIGENCSGIHEKLLNIYDALQHLGLLRFIAIFVPTGSQPAFGAFYRVVPVLGNTIDANSSRPSGGRFLLKSMQNSATSCS